MTDEIQHRAVQSNPRGLLAQVSRDIELAIRYMDARVAEENADSVIEWLTHLRISRGLTQSTICTYCKNMTRFFSWMREQGLGVDRLNINHMEDWQKWMYVVRKYGEQFRMQHISAVRQYFAWRETYMHQPNPAKFIRGPKVTKRIPKKYSTEDLQKLFSTCDLDTDIGIRDYAILVFLYATGFRREELQQLKLDQVTLRERVGKVKVLGKGAKERELSFQGEAVDALRNWLAVRDNVAGVTGDAVWVSVNGIGKISSQLTLRAIENMVSRRAKRAKLKHSGIHMMRVTFATDLYDEGVDIEIIQELMGHEKLETTRRYIVISERRRKARMPNNRMNIVTGRNKGGLPLWVKKKQQEQTSLLDD